MKVNFSADEWYPVYSYLAPKDTIRDWMIDGTIELTEEELQDFIQCEQKFEAWQTRLREQIRGY